MGADLLVATFRLPLDTNGKTISSLDEFGAAAETTLYNRISDLDLDDIDEWELETYYGIDPEEQENLIDAGHRGLLLEQVATVAVESFKNLLRGVKEGWRDLSWYIFDDPTRRWVLSGGMSWGDAPTESFSLLQQLSVVAGAFEEPLPAT